MTYETGRKTGELPKDLHRLGKALARGGDFKAIADAAMNCPGLKKAIEDRICALINDKCKKLCSKDASLLQSPTKDSIFNFSWETVGKELADKAPLFHRLLLALADPKSLSQRWDTERNPSVCAAAAILLKNRDKGMSLVPYVISTILKVGRTSKKVKAVTFVCCLSPFKYKPERVQTLRWKLSFSEMSNKAMKSSQVKLSPVDITF